MTASVTHRGHDREKKSGLPAEVLKARFFHLSKNATACLLKLNDGVQLVRTYIVKTEDVPLRVRERGAYDLCLDALKSHAAGLPEVNEYERFGELLDDLDDLVADLLLVRETDVTAEAALDVIQTRLESLLKDYDTAGPDDEQ